MSTSETQSTAPTLPETLRLGPTHLTVSDLDGSIAFYENALGLQLHAREDDVASLGTGGEDLLVLTGEPGAQLGGRNTGLYHYALLFSSRDELARAVLRLASSQTRIEGASDHGVSEAIYLRDPDDNGIELYVDRPRDDWPAPTQPGERVGMYTIGLDLKDLLAAISGEQPTAHAGPGLQTGHLHRAGACRGGGRGDRRPLERWLSRARPVADLPGARARANCVAGRFDRGGRRA